jgi:hypothetical protein
VGNAFSDYGTLAHDIMKNQLMFRQLKLPIMSNQSMKEDFQKRFYEMKWGKFPSDSMKRTYLYDGLNYFEHWDSFKDYEVLEVERFVDFKFCGYKCTGGMDSLLTKDGLLYLIDHKSAKPYDEDEMEKNVRQLYFYGPAIAQLYDKFPDKICFNFFRKNKIVTMDWDMKKYRETVEWFKNGVQNIKNCRSFEPNPDAFFCNRMCNHRLSCEKKADWGKKTIVKTEEFDGYE